MKTQDCKWYKDLLVSMVNAHNTNAMFTSRKLRNADFVINHAKVRGVGVMKMLCSQVNKRLRGTAYNPAWLDCDIDSYLKWYKLHTKGSNIVIKNQAFNSPLAGLVCHIARYRCAIYGIDCGGE